MRSVVGLTLVATALCGWALLVGCSSGTGEQPTTGAGPASAPSDPIPPVRDPRSLNGVAPCQLFTQQQLSENQIDQPGKREDVLGTPGCEWRDTKYTREVKVFTDVGNDVLSNVYAQRGTFAVFEVTEVAGHPAIRTKDNVDGTTCNYRVAAAEAQTFTLRFTSLPPALDEPCGAAAALSAAVLKNLPPLKG